MADCRRTSRAFAPEHLARRIVGKLVTRPCTALPHLVQLQDGGLQLIGGAATVEGRTSARTKLDARFADCADLTKNGIRASGQMTSRFHLLCESPA